MLLKTLSVLVLLHIIAVWGYPKNFMIKNKKTGMVLDGANQNVDIGYWANKNSQLWTLEKSDNPDHYFVQNVENKRVLDACPVTRAILTWKKHGSPNQRWNLNPDEDTRIQVKYFPNEFLVHKNNPRLQGSTANDDSDIWLLVEPSALAK